ncbi:DUF7283 family protein [Salinarchaeum laminariae]|uniref:DUF7283 family protein n=1 Tax=Salinarchaeum laminariae TaxID=869888 RepID=UPI0020BF6199|nr:hypothetical protein [Salinarchaeum laminariae]
MLGPPIDAWYVWIGVSMVSLAVLGVAVAVTPEPPSRATPAAETIEEVAASRAPASATYPIDADRVLVSEYRLVIEGEDREAVTIDHGRMTPAERGTDLRRVALGASPNELFESTATFAEAIETARDERRRIEPAGDRLIVRKLSYGGTDVTLVTA